MTVTTLTNLDVWTPTSAVLINSDVKTNQYKLDADYWTKIRWIVAQLMIHLMIHLFNLIADLG